MIQYEYDKQRQLNNGEKGSCSMIVPHIIWHFNVNLYKDTYIAFYDKSLGNCLSLLMKVYRTHYPRSKFKQTKDQMRIGSAVH